MGMSTLGIALANFIPQSWGLGFAGVLSLVGILCSMATTRLRMLAVLIAGAAAIVLIVWWTSRREKADAPA